MDIFPILFPSYHLNCLLTQIQLSCRKKEPIAYPCTCLNSNVCINILTCYDCYLDINS